MIRLQAESGEAEGNEDTHTHAYAPTHTHTHLAHLKLNRQIRKKEIASCHLEGGKGTIKKRQSLYLTFGSFDQRQTESLKIAYFAYTYGKMLMITFRPLPVLISLAKHAGSCQGSLAEDGRDRQSSAGFSKGCRVRKNCQ